MKNCSVALKMLILWHAKCWYGSWISTNEHAIFMQNRMHSDKKSAWTCHTQRDIMIDAIVIGFLRLKIYCAGDLMIFTNVIKQVVAWVALQH